MISGNLNAVLRIFFFWIIPKLVYCYHYWYKVTNIGINIPKSGKSILSGCSIMGNWLVCVTYHRVFAAEPDRAGGGHSRPGTPARLANTELQVGAAPTRQPTRTVSRNPPARSTVPVLSPHHLRHYYHFPKVPKSVSFERLEKLSLE